jgi:hypothetical protein
MSDALSSPLRIQPQSCEFVTAKKAKKQLERFVTEFTARTSGPGGAGGDTAVSIQLEKLARAILEDAS